MNKIIFFLISYLLFGSVLIAGTNQPCKLSNDDPFGFIDMLRGEIIEGLITFNKNEKILSDGYNQAPQVGRLYGPEILKDEQSYIPHGSGFYMEHDDGSKNTIITSAHNFFDEDGNLRFPLETYKFELGNNLKTNDVQIFSIEKIECAYDTTMSIEYSYLDQCRVTLNKDIQGIKPLRKWNGSLKDLKTTYVVGFHGHKPAYRYQRSINRCTGVNHEYDANEKVIYSNCNTSGGLSGSPHGVYIDGEFRVFGVLKGAATNKYRIPIASKSVQLLDTYNPKFVVKVTSDNYKNTANTFESND